MSTSDETLLPVIFLDFDGVLHGLDEAALDDDFHVVRDNPRLFGWRPILEQVLAPYPEVKIIVASDWRRLFDDKNLAKLLGPALGPRVIGAVEICRCTRAEEIVAEAIRRDLRHWLAIDDHPSVVEACQAGDMRFIACQSDRGLSDAQVQHELQFKLAALLRQHRADCR